MKLKTFIDECRKRKIFKGFSIYAIVSWLIIQVAATTFPYLGIPGKAVTFIIILALIGLPISLIFSWYYNITLDGIEAENDDGQDDGFKERSGKFFKNFIIIVSFLVAVVVVLLLINIFNTPAEVIPQENKEDKIAVLAFDNVTGDESLALFGKAISDWLSHGIVENKLGRVISNDILERYLEPLNTANSTMVLQEFLVPKKVISGSIYKNGDQLIIKALISDGVSNDHAFPEVRTSIEDRITGIEKLQELVLGYLATKGSPEITLQEDPPKYEAYEHLLAAKSLNIGNEEVLSHLNSALRIDSNYFEAKVYRISYFYNRGEFEKADSLLQKIDIDESSSFRQKNLLAFYEALLSGKNRVVYECWKSEYSHAPFSLPDNSTMMTIALQFVNRPEEIRQVFDQIDMSEMNVQNCEYCVFRLYTMAMADIAMDNYASAVSLLEPHIGPNVSSLITRPLTSAYIRSNQLEKLEHLFEQLSNIMTKDSWKQHYFTAAREFLLLFDDENAASYLEKAITYYTAKKDTLNITEGLILQKRWDEARSVLESYILNHPDHKRTKANLAICYHLLDKPEKAASIESALNQHRELYEMGETDYLLAYINAYTGDEEKSLSYLNKAVAGGHLFIGSSFENEVAFRQIRSSEAFQKVLDYWH